MKKILLLISLVFCFLGSCQYAYTQGLGSQPAITPNALADAPGDVQVSAIAFNIFVVLAVAFVVTLVYSIRSTPTDFNLLTWLQTSSNRFIAGGILGVLISVLVVVSPDVDALFQIIGFNASHTPVSIGLALGAFLIAGVSGTKTEE